MSKQPTNPSHPFSSQKDLPSFQSDLQSRLMFPLQGQLPRKPTTTPHTLLHPPPDASDLTMFHPTKKFKPDDNPLGMLLDPHAAMSLFPNLAQHNKPPIEIPTAKEPIVPELRSLGFDPQAQFRAGKSRGPTNPTFPGFDNPTRGSMSQLTDPNFAGLSSLLPGGGADDLVMSQQSLARDQALKNMLLMQALQNPNDLLTSRLLQAQAAQAQQQAQLLGHPSFQGPQGMRLSGYGGVNPMTLQYLELQKRLQNDYALMQAQAQVAQAMQAAQRMQGQGLSDPLGGAGRFRMDGNPENLVKLESGVQFPTGLESQLRMMYNEGLGGQLRPDNIPQLSQLYERMGREPEVKKEHTDHHALDLQQQQQLLRQQQQRLEEKLQPRKPVVEKPSNGLVHSTEREVRLPQKEMKIEQPRPEPKVTPRAPPQRVVEPMEEDPRAKSAGRGRGRPVREVPTKIVVQPPPMVVESSRSRDRRSTNRYQEMMRYEASDDDEEEEKVVPQRRSNGARVTRNSTKKPEVVIPVKPVVTIPAPTTTVVRVEPPKILGIIQPKDLFKPRLAGGYSIEVHLPSEKASTSFKRTALGLNHQIRVYDCDLNDEEELPEKRLCKLISNAVWNPEDEIEDIQLTPLDPLFKHTIRSRVIKVGEQYQAYIEEFDLNSEYERRPRLCKLVSRPEDE